MSQRPTVVVAMSGGVDSSLTAALLLHEGYHVIGMTMQIWDNQTVNDDPENRGCCSLSAVDDARNVANKLGIPYYVVNFRDYFQETVVDYFVKEYAKGRTPNPCIACNRYVKFEALLRKALEIGADYVATGHYARIEQDSQTGRYVLRKGLDEKKDQSYVLYHLNQHSLAHFLMPLGTYTKDKTRALAREYGLSVADKPESQEICFVPNDDYHAFLEEKNPKSLRPGNFVDVEGNILGKHQGLPLYTVGQRKGLGIAAGHPLYVVELRPDKNEVVLGCNDDVFATSLIANDLNFIAFDELNSQRSVLAKIRYNAKESPAVIEPVGNGKVQVRFVQKQRAITPGQSVVFYEGDQVLGGGIIEKVVK